MHAPLFFIGSFFVSFCALHPRLAHRGAKGFDFFQRIAQFVAQFFFTITLAAASGMLHEVTDFLTQMVQELGYVGIFLVTLIESTFVPLPAEVTIPFAGNNVAHGTMNYWLVLLFSTSGVVVGSCINYWIGLRFGRGFILRFGKYFFLKPSYMDKVEVFFQQHGAFSVFLGRLIPGVRHYIAFPAGMMRMPLRQFLPATFLGGLTYMWILMHLGYEAGKEAGENGKIDLERMGLLLAAFIGLMVLSYLAKVFLMKPKKVVKS